MSILEKFNKFSPVVKKAYETSKEINLQVLAQFTELNLADLIDLEDEGLVIAKVAYQKEQVTSFRITKKGYLSCSNRA